MASKVGKYSSLSIFIPIIAALILLFFFPGEADILYQQNYIVDSIAVVTVLVLISIYIFRNGFDIFDPLYLITAIYGMMYFVTPIYDILNEEYSWFGYYLFDNGIKATLIALAGYFAFYIFYNVKFVLRRKNQLANSQEVEVKNADPDISQRGKIVPFILVMYAFCFAANVYYLLRSGYTSLTYVLTLGMFGGEQEAAEAVSDIGFISNFSYCLPTVVLLYWEYGRSKWLKGILFVPMLMLQIARGFRFFVVQIAITFFAYWFIRKQKRPGIIKIILSFVALMVPVLLMTLFRDSMRAGDGMELSTFFSNDLKEAFDDTVWFNFRIYKNFYGMVDAIPEKFGYVYGGQMIIGTIIMMVPRIIWPGKISTKAGEDLAYIIGSNLKNTGQAYPNIGEYYYALGIVGVLVCMAIYGIWSKSLKNKYMPYEAGGINNIVFATLLGANLQLLIRGYTPSNFWYLIFSLLPVVAVRIIGKNGSDKR